ncbi:PREDICTED: uncharacterized protein LOC109484501 [Branchiostoma belcheri]|uniref:Uncharacterized protein LOC109484501 n=1 Tax=Branchiostoma belcheri TaxID=7741 RepID=A0A6P5AMV3_BRABE|nr:PREDICTED: uncharacterized protein LOC109484501 [Branchiostoma belcheri]
MSTMLQAVVLLLLVVAHIGNADNSAVSQDFVPLCSNPEYDVTFSPATVTVSTTVFDLSLTTAKLRARHRLMKYFRGANDQGVEMTAPFTNVIQTRAPTDLFREVTLAIPLPEDVWDNIPKPTDSKVRIDKVPRNIAYVRNVRNKAALGFSVEREAKKLFGILKKNGEPYWGDDDYYYIIQSKSPENGRVINQVAIFSINDRASHVYIRAKGLKAHVQNQLPVCLRKGNPEAWDLLGEAPKDVDADIDLTRVEAGENYCNDPDCPESKVLQTYDTPLEKREYTGTASMVFAAAPSCHLHAAYGMAQRAIYDKLNAAGLMEGRPFRMFGPVMGQIYQRKAGEDECNKVFVQSIDVPEEVLASEKLPDFVFGQEPYDQDVVMDLKVHRRDYPGPFTAYVRHFGGYADEEEIYRQGKALMADLDSRGICYIPNMLEFVEYNRGSRQFDRHNEVLYYAFPGVTCEPEKPDWFIPVHLDSPPKGDETNALDLLLPSLDDLCRNNDCVKRQTVRRFENFLEEKIQTPGSSVCAKQKFCTSVREASKQAISKLLSYFNGYNKEQQRIDMPRPLFHYMNLTNIAKEGCNKEMLTCSFVPKRIAAVPPEPVDKNILLIASTEVNGYTMPFGDLTDKEIMQTMIHFNKSLAGLEKFGIAYDKQTFGIMEYFAADEELHHNALFVRKLEKGMVSEEDVVPESTDAEERPRLHSLVKDHGDNVLEIRMNPKMYACVDTESCNAFFTRKTMIALHDYFAGNNDGNVDLGSLSPLFYHTGEPKVEGCPYGLSSCAAIPEEFYENTPKPSDERVTIFDATKLTGVGYATTLYEAPEGDEGWTAVFEKLAAKLDEKDLLFNREYGFFFREAHPFDTSNEPAYVAYWKQSAESEGEGESEMSAEEDKEMPTEGPAAEKSEDGEKAEMPTELSAVSKTAMPDKEEGAAVPATEAPAGSSAETEER